MKLQEFIEKIAEIEARAASLVADATSLATLDAARHSLLGRKSGALTAMMKELPSLSPEERREAGAAVNRAKTAIEDALDTGAIDLASMEAASSTADLTMPARRQWKGA
ncbi:MAG: phenylalanine--tRNA ligase subunit alpha, partial [Gemmatimonadota bacterium]|nr:phenylalanine--tRNA ligase subunit alpha [Gemmatimonadota bacterium]